MQRPKSLRERFESKLKETHEPVTGCLLWTGAVGTAGYGVLRRPDTNRLMSAHRVAWELWKGPLEKHVYLYHSCGNRLCCETSHLYRKSKESVKEFEQRVGKIKRKPTQRAAAAYPKSILYKDRRARRVSK